MISVKEYYTELLSDEYSQEILKDLKLKLDEILNEEDEYTRASVLLHLIKLTFIRLSSELKGEVIKEISSILLNDVEKARKFVSEGGGHKILSKLIRKVEK